MSFFLITYLNLAKLILGKPRNSLHFSALMYMNFPWVSNACKITGFTFFEISQYKNVSHEPQELPILWQRCKFKARVHIYRSGI